MHSRIIYNHRLMETAKARAALVTPAALYGRGVFTTLAVHHGKPFLWPEHWLRLKEHAARAGLDASGLSAENVGESLRQLIEANRIEEGRARVTLLATNEHGIWKVKGLDAGRNTDLLIMTGDLPEAPADGLALTVSPYRLSTMSALVGVKSVNYLEHILAWEEARARDFDEAVTLNERGELVSATLANIFWVTHGTIHTPALATGALSGTTRACIMELAGEISAPLVEGVYDLSDLGDADEVFLTSAGHGLRVVTTFDFRRYTVPVGSVALRLREALRQLMLDAD